MAAFNGQASLQFLSHTAVAQTVSNTFHVANSGAGSPPDFDALLALATQAAAQFATTYKALMPAASTWDTVVAKQVIDPTTTTVALEATYAVDAVGTRAIAGSGVPNSLCGVLALKTPNASRRFRGHLMLPPAIDGDAMNGNNWVTSNAYYTAMVAFAAEMAKGTPDGAGWTGSELSNYGLVIYSRTAALAAEPSVANVQTLVVRPKIAWLRSRERGAT